MKPTYKELENRIKILEEKLILLDILQHTMDKNQQFLDILLDTIPNPVFFKDTNGIYQKANDAFSKIILGINKEEIEGKSLFELPHVIPKELALLYNKKDNELFENPGTQFYEAKVMCSDNKFHFFYFYKATVKDASNKVIGLVGVMLDVTELKDKEDKLNQKNRELKQLSYKDSLTGIYNRRKFDEVFPEKLQTKCRENTILNFVLLDIDNFKLYNDTYGHKKGDLVLKELAYAIQNRLARDNDYFFRIGGEEFGLIFESKDENTAIDYVNKIREDVENLNIEHIKNGSYNKITVSCGLVSILNRNTNSDAVFIQADKSLYEAKNKDKNRVCNFIIK